MYALQLQGNSSLDSDGGEARLADREPIVRRRLKWRPSSGLITSRRLPLYPLQRFRPYRTPWTSRPS